MNFVKGLFLPKYPNPTIEVGDHVYRHRDAKDGLIHTKKKKDDKGNTKKWNMYELGDYEWMSYGDAKKNTDNMAAWLLEQGFQKGDRMLIYAKTRIFIVCDVACCAIGVVISTAYDSMPPDAVAHIINEIEPKGIFTEISLMETLHKAKEKGKEGSYEPKMVIYTGKHFEAQEQLDKFKSYNEMQVHHWSDILETKINSKDIASSAPKTDDLAMIMYSSGTTGNPKGIELTHGNIVAAMSAAEHLVLNLIDHGKHCYIGFLPLAHVLEFIVEFIFISTAVPIGYGTVRTLMPESVCGKDGQGKGKGDLETLQPTIMAGVPAIWERIRKGVMHELDKQHWSVRKAFDAAVETKWQMLKFFGQENTITRTMDATIFAPVRAKTGGRLVYCLSGGAPLSFDTHKFMTTAVCYLLQGYGLTECCGLGAITVPSLGMVTGVIGPPSPSIEFKLVDVPETDYKAENGCGELWIRGPSLMRGYYKLPDLTKEAITEDGWFKTGDVANLNDDGTFAITDRAKNLVKLSHGEYIALESLESKYRNSHRIKNICIIANSDKDYIVGVVEPSKKDVDKDELLKELQQTAKESDCNRAEIIKDIVVTKDVEWADKFLTTSGKLKRKDIEKEYKDDIEEIYK
ncbi:acetyl-CoA synthetase-like protein [Lichtheimia hyalospora FSU 10163]|nr:acetyl-CoA synthetase-like protein [Lichtheimia hyalospora FSU 10163]